jgi:hypothetical protein
LRVEQAGDDQWLHIEDNGIGMSERTLTGALLDFGNSFWQTEALQEEWPGLESSGIRPSRRYDAGKSDARVLEFESISARPIVRTPTPKEASDDFITCVSVKLKPQGIIEEPDNSYLYDDRMGSRYRRLGKGKRFEIVKNLRSVLRLVSGVDVEVVIEAPGQRFMHSASWADIDSEKFLEEVLAELPSSERALWRSAYSPFVRHLKDADGNIFGRAALQFSSRRLERSIYEQSATSGVSVGGFVNWRQPENWFLGVINGETNDASRNRTAITVPPDVVAKWATDQAPLITESRFSLGDRILAAQRIDGLGGDPQNLPFCFCGGKFVSRSQFAAIAGAEREINVLLSEGHKSRLSWQKMSTLGASMFTTKVKEHVCALIWEETTTDLFTEERNAELVTSASSKIQKDDISGYPPQIERVFSWLEDSFGNELRFTLQAIQAFDVDHHFPPQQRWVLTAQWGKV